MSFLPIVLRELRVASRRRATYLGRIGAALVGICVLGWMLITLGSNAFMQGQLGTAIFATLSMFSFIYCLLAGTRATADCLAEEKREGTLGLLFLTDLRGYDVVFGKLTATSLTMFYGLLAVLPVLTVPLLLGGITGEKVLRTALLLVNTLFFSLTAGLLVSSVSHNERKAAGGTTALIGVVTGGLPGLWAYLAYKFYEHANLPVPPDFLLPLVAPSPGFGYAMLENDDHRFWWSLGATHALSWAFLALASWQLPRSWQQSAPSAGREKFEAKLNLAAFGRADRQAAFRARLLDLNPVLWLNARNRVGTALVWAALAAGALVWLWCVVKYPKDIFEPGAFLMTALAAHTILKMWFASESCRRFAEDRRNGALELILSTPLTDAEIFRGQKLALLRMFGGPTAVILIVDALFIVGCWSQPSGTGMARTQEDALTWTFVFLAGMAVLVADLFTMSWLGMWAGLTARSVNRASGSLISRVMVLPWAVFWMGGMLMIPLNFLGNLNLGAEFFIFAWAALSLGNDLLWYHWAKGRMVSRFRAVATERFDAPKGVLARAGGALGRFYGRTTAAKRPPVSNT
ncbi:MAG: ABC transporter permease subunit [Verrucomicrobia bacterium]|nr:ABC transporter permease subunit [Verrucomicrobiota bacterium]